MKNAKRFASLLLALVMVFAMAISVSAAPTEIEAGTGSILIKDNGTVKASEKTFAAFKILDLKAYVNEEGVITTYEYTVPAGMEDFYADRYSQDKTAVDFLAGVTAGIEAETDLYAFARAAITAAGAAGIAPVSGEAVEGGYQFSDLALGYYAIEDTTGAGAIPVSAIVLTSGTPNVEIEVKADKPSVEKKIDDDNNLDTTNDRVDINDAAIGDTITYVLSSKVPAMTGYDKYFFIMKDHMSAGLTYDNNMVVTIGSKTLTEGTDYILTVTENEDGTTDLKIVFVNFIQYNTASDIGKAIQVAYTATLNNDAVLNPAPNTNDVYLQYSNNPEVDYNGENEPNEEDEDEGKDPLGETPKDEVETHTTALQIIKTDVEGNRLTGAEFSITGETMNVVRLVKEVFTADENGAYWKLTDGTYTTDDPNAEGMDQTKYESLTDKYSKNTEVTFQQKTGETISATAVVGDDGVLRFEGLPAGVYTIKETKAPEGYNMLTQELVVTIGWDAENKDFTFDGAAEIDNIGSITVINRNGNEMPETGGMGTTVFYVLGGVLLVAALVILVSRKRMGAAN